MYCPLASLRGILPILAGPCGVASDNLEASSSGCREVCCGTGANAGGWENTCVAESEPVAVWVSQRERVKQGSGLSRRTRRDSRFRWRDGVASAPGCQPGQCPPAPPTRSLSRSVEQVVVVYSRSTFGSEIDRTRRPSDGLSRRVRRNMRFRRRVVLSFPGAARGQCPPASPPRSLSRSTRSHTPLTVRLSPIPAGGDGDRRRSGLSRRAHRNDAFRWRVCELGISSREPTGDSARQHRQRAHYRGPSGCGRDVHSIALSTGGYRQTRR